MTIINPALADAIAAKGVPLSADLAPLTAAREADIRKMPVAPAGLAGVGHHGSDTERRLYAQAVELHTARGELLAELDRMRCDVADFSGRVNELESRLCECEPVREHRNFRRPAFYQHAADCPVNGGGPR